MAMNVTLVPKGTYRTGRESGDRQKSVRRVSFVRAHTNSHMLVGPIQKILTDIASIGGLLLIVIGAKILLEHLFFANTNKSDLGLDLIK